jgi:hypothetical protein
MKVILWISFLLTVLCTACERKNTHATTNMKVEKADHAGLANRAGDPNVTPAPTPTP